jgi:hypothetical protein
MSTIGMRQTQAKMALSKYTQALATRRNQSLQRMRLVRYGCSEQVQVGAPLSSFRYAT